MAFVVPSRNGVPIRLIGERWAHITEEHPELPKLELNVLETIAQPEMIVGGHAGELLALRQVETGKLMAAICREFEDDGFIITAFLTRRADSLWRRKRLWQ